MNDVKINYAAVFVAAVAYWLLGAVWFTVLAKPWLAGIGKTLEQLQQSGSPMLAYLVAFICNLVLASVLAWAVIHTGDQTATRGLRLGGLLWLGFVATTTATNYVFEARSIQIFAINAGYPLVGMLLMGAIVGTWKKKEKAEMANPASA